MISDQTAAGPVVRCMNVKYSPNLGDGLLSECLESALIQEGASPDTTSVDLAGRSAYGEVMSGRGTLLTALDALPPVLRNYAVRAPLAAASRRKWEPHYVHGLDGAGAVVIGGGNLLSDQDLNFPTKLALALSVAGARKLPVAIYGCGMSGSWSVEGDRRLRKALRATPPRAVFLRDDQSCKRWNARFATETDCSAHLVRDPGLLACETWGSAPQPAPDAPMSVGIGIMSHVAVRYHGKASLDEASLNHWYIDIARALVSRGIRVTAFTNGAPEDRVTAKVISSELTPMGIPVLHPEKPAELSSLVGGFSAIVAYRMHAVIAAYAHAVPALALRWDDKLDSFMASVERSNWVADPAALSPHDAAQRLIKAAQDGVDLAYHRKAVGEARGGVRKLLKALTGRCSVR